MGALGACVGASGSDDPGEAAAGRRPAPEPAEVVVEAGSLDAPQRAALRALAARPGAGGEHAGGDHAGGDHGEHGAGHHGEAQGSASPLSPALRAQLAEAEAAARELMVEPRLSRAGYHLGSYYSSGVGTHYIDWRLVGEPFDPARPAMLLVDTTPGHRRRLAGFSYWVRSDGPPEGFAGDDDEWHVHEDLCFVRGVQTKEGVADASECRGGVVIPGGDLWMLHAWVVPGYENPDGVFAPASPKLCPPRHGIDAGWC